MQEDLPSRMLHQHLATAGGGGRMSQEQTCGCLAIATSLQAVHSLTGRPIHPVLQYFSCHHRCDPRLPAQMGPCSPLPSPGPYPDLKAACSSAQLLPIRLLPAAAPNELQMQDWVCEGTRHRAGGKERRQLRLLLLSPLLCL